MPKPASAAKIAPILRKPLYSATLGARPERTPGGPRHVCPLRRTRLTTVHRPGWTVHTQFSHGKCTCALFHALRKPWLHCRGFLFVEYVHTMSAKKLSRAFAQGEIKKLRRMKQPLGQILLELAPPLPPRARKARREEGAGRHQQLTSNDALRARGDNPKGRGPLPHPASLMAAGGYVSTARPSPSGIQQRPPAAGQASGGLAPLKLEASGPPRNPVAAALAQRSLSSAAGKHIRTRGAQRRADNVALRKAIQNPFLND